MQVPVTCSGSLFFRITDGYKACFAISDVEKNIQRTGTSVMRSVLGAFSYDEVFTFLFTSPNLKRHALTTMTGHC